MNNSLKNFLKYDRIFLALTVIFLILLAVFLYYLGNTHQPGCTYYYQHTTELLFPFVIAVPTLLAIYTLAKVRLTRVAKPTNGQLFGVVPGAAGILVAGAVVYVVLGVGLFFGNRC